MNQKLTRAILWQNGMLMVFDERGQQVSDYQGMGDEMIPKLEKDFPEVIIEAGVWR